MRHTQRETLASVATQLKLYHYVAIKCLQQSHSGLAKVWHSTPRLDDQSQPLATSLATQVKGVATYIRILYTVLWYQLEGG